MMLQPKAPTDSSPYSLEIEVGIPLCQNRRPRRWKFALKFVVGEVPGEKQSSQLTHCKIRLKSAGAGSGFKQLNISPDSKHCSVEAVRQRNETQMLAHHSQEHKVQR